MNSSEAMEFLSRVVRDKTVHIYHTGTEYRVYCEGNKSYQGVSLADAIERFIAEEGWRYSGD